MNLELQERILNATSANSITKVDFVQSLWSDFGALERVWLDGYDYESIVIKRIIPPTEMNHPRGWNSDVSSQRKLKSYEIERSWYEEYVNKLPSDIKTPEFLFYIELNNERVLGMEDLLSAGFELPYADNSTCFNRCLEWLAKFHAFHMNNSGEGLWEIGTYWHLDTRKDEWDAMDPGTLKDAASDIDQKLNQCKFQTLVHGDAKPANFCFTPDFGQVAAVDFQYVGKGCGMKDLIYLMSSTLSEDHLLKEDKRIVDRYFDLLEQALKEYERNEIDFQSLRKEWQLMYVMAWMDFARFLEGWSPKHPRFNRYVKEVTQTGLLNLNR